MREIDLNLLIFLSAPQIHIPIWYVEVDTDRNLTWSNPSESSLLEFVKWHCHFSVIHKIKHPK